MSLIEASAYFKKLYDFLHSSCKIESKSRDFEEKKSNSERIEYLREVLKKNSLLVEGTLKKEKSNVFAESCLQEGRICFTQERYLEALEFYNQSLCFAETGSETMGRAYANRSDVYFMLKRYESCLKNMQLARDNFCPNEVLENLPSHEQVRLLRDQSPSDDPVGIEYFDLAYKPNEKLPFISDCLEVVKTDGVYGRYISTKKVLQPGDVVCCEEPSVKMLLPSHFYKYCATCLKSNFLDLVPCEECTCTMFCSKKCETVGGENFHEFECQIVDKLNGLTTNLARFALRTFFEALAVCEGELTDLISLMRENRGSKETFFDYEYPNTRENILKVVDCLTTNESLRSQAEMFVMVGIVAVVCDLVLESDKLNKIVASVEDGKEFLYSFMIKQFQILHHGIFHAFDNGVLNKPENLQYGWGNYPFSALFNHSCAPNVDRVFQNNKNCVVVIRPIAEGEELFDCYDNTHHIYETKANRQSRLYSRFKFKCSCDACTNDYPLISGLQYKIRSNFPYFLAYDKQKLERFDVFHAKTMFNLYRNYLKENNAEYPCIELSEVQGSLMTCFRIFAQLCRD